MSPGICSKKSGGARNVASGSFRVVIRIEDITLGAFGNLQPSETLNHLVRYLSTWSGSECLIQYGAKVLIPILQARARLQHRAGMLPIIQWLISLERAHPPTRRLLTIERTQGWTMLAFYPLQHLSYFRKHDLVPATLPFPPAFPPAVSLWSSRLWATYVVLQLAHLREDRTLLIKKRRALSRLSSVEKERAELARRWDTWYNELAVNLSFLPMTIHWSLEKGLFKNDAWISFFGLVAAIASFRNGWKATALPPSTPSTPLSPPEPETEDTPRISDKQQVPQSL
ncbi:hypothetical protein BJV77DRAFT_1058526 [Russula vinacea]|nr:hypothetical protein BJV77DRAFT_1058526 [Russula vinacea]